MFGFVSDAIDSVGSAVESVVNTATSTAQSAFGNIGGGVLDFYGYLAPTVASFVGVDPNLVRNSYKAMGNTFNSIAGGNYVSNKITATPQTNQNKSNTSNFSPLPYQNELIQQTQTTANNPNNPNNNNLFIFGGIALVAYLFINNKIKF